MENKNNLADSLPTFVQANQALLMELEELVAQEETFVEGVLSSCTIKSYQRRDDEESITVLGVLSIPDSPVQLVYLNLPRTSPKVFMTNLEEATVPQIRYAARYAEPFRNDLEGFVSRSALTEAYDDAFSLIMDADLANRSDKKKEVKRVFLAEYGDEFSRAFDTAMYRRGYKS